MQESRAKSRRNPHFKDEKQTLLTYLQTMDQPTLKRYLSLSDNLLNLNYNRYQNFDELHTALNSYTGAQFKALDYQSLSKTEKQFLDDHLYIISGLYGLVKPKDTIGLYRLPMALKYKDIPLTSYWKASIKSLLHDEVILNLASAEYSDALDQSLTVINVKFDKAHSMVVKQLRGFMVRFIAEEKVTAVEPLKAFQALSYKFSYFDKKTNTLVYNK